MTINNYPTNMESNSFSQRTIYYTIFYGCASFTLVLVALLLLYLSCSRKYRLNWFEKNLLERVHKDDESYSQNKFLHLTAESEIRSNKSINNTKKNKSQVTLVNSKNFNIFSKKSEFIEEFSYESMETMEEDPQPIARSDKQVILSGTKLTRPPVYSMNIKLDQTKIDSAFYQENIENQIEKEIQKEGSLNVSLSYDLASGILSVRLIQLTRLTEGKISLNTLLNVDQLMMDPSSTKIQKNFLLCRFPAFTFKAKDLLPRNFSGTSDPYAKVRLLPDNKNVWQTRIHKKTLNPVFDEDFVFEVPSSLLNYRTLEIILYDFDAYSRHLSLGEVRLPLSDLNLSEKVTLWKALEPCLGFREKAELGDLMVTLLFLQSAKRLAIVINKARNLRVVNDSRLSSDPFVKVSIILNGKRIKKKKTTMQRNTVNPIFNEPMAFDISKEDMSKILIEFSVYHHNKLGIDELLGIAVIGSAPICQSDENHFFNELLTAKTAKTIWLTLSDKQ